MIKRLLSVLPLLCVAFSAFAQLEGYTYQIEPYIIPRCPSEIKNAIDTVHTADKYVDIVIFDNQTWEYLYHMRPGIDSTQIYDKWWNTESLHAYKDYPKEAFETEMELQLVDSTHFFCVPRQGKIHSGYKMRRSRPHYGSDIPLDTGDSVKAAFDGVVRFSSGSKTGGYGNLIVIRHSNGLETYYGHLSKRFVNAGESVKAGDIIGLGGSTGRSTGPHLHFETRYKGRTFDPERIIDFEKGVLRDETFTVRKDYFSVYSHQGMSDEESIAASQAKYYKVRRGDTLGKIASRNGTTVSKICKLNGIKSTKTLRIGESLRIR